MPLLIRFWTQTAGGQSAKASLGRVEPSVRVVCRVRPFLLCGDINARSSASASPRIRRSVDSFSVFAQNEDIIPKMSLTVAGI